MNKSFKVQSIKHSLNLHVRTCTDIFSLMHNVVKVKHMEWANVAGWLIVIGVNRSPSQGYLSG